MDPLVMKFSSTSSYCFGVNSPLVIVDPDGRDIVIYYQGGSFRFNGRNMIDMPNNAFVEEVVNAYLYNIQNGGGEALEVSANNPDVDVFVKQVFDGKNRAYKGVIYWDIQKGLLTSNGDILSPATILEHEAAHALAQVTEVDAYNIRLFAGDSQFRNKEERRVIEQNESQTAKANGEIRGGLSRNCHCGVSVIVAGDATSTKVDYDATYNLLIMMDKEGYYMDEQIQNVQEHEKKND